MMKAGSNSPLKRDPALLPALLVIWAAMGVFILYPLVRLLLVAFFDDGQFTFSHIIHTFSNWYDRQALYNSLFLAVTVSLAGVCLGFIYAYAVTRLALPRAVKWLLGAITVLPLISPPFTSSIAMTLALGPNGMLIKWLGLPNFSIYGFWGTWLSEVLTLFPVAFLTLNGVLQAIDPNLEDAALSLGETKWRTFLRITCPLAVPGIANAFLLLFASSLADFATPLILAGHSFPVLPTQAYLQITGLHDLKGGAALSFVLLLPALGIYLLQRYWVGNRSYVTITGKAGARTKARGLDTCATVLILTICLLTASFILFLYSIIFVGSVVKVWGVNYGLTLDHYNYVFTRGFKAITDTLLIALTAMPIGALLGVMIGYLTTRKEFVGNRLLEFVALLNYALPGTVIGIAYIVAFNSGPIVLTGTMMIIVSAYVFRYDATGIRSTIASLKQIDQSLEEASLSLGESAFNTFRKVTLPLIIPAVSAGMKFLFIRAMTAISATIFLVSVRWTLLTTRILECMTELQFAQASAFSVILILIVFTASGLITLCFRLAYPRYDRI
ncbi:ABC transporter permease [Anaerosporomusa subterranea]|nr:iron ABC transporter permease [Anaerosporomusa subterranea]